MDVEKKWHKCTEKSDTKNLTKNSVLLCTTTKKVTVCEKPTCTCTDEHLYTTPKVSFPDDVQSRRRISASKVIKEGFQFLVGRVEIKLQQYTSLFSPS